MISYTGMKPCSIIVALSALLFSSAKAIPITSFEQERSVPFVTFLSSTIVRGYLNPFESPYLRPHVCRPLRPVRAQRLVGLSANGAIREIGYTVACRHGVVYLPKGSAIASALLTPNRSSRFAFDETTPRITDSPIVIFSRRIIRIPDRPLPPPPLPPQRPPFPPHPIYTNWPPIVVRPPTNSVPRPPVIDVPPIHGSTGMESNRQPPSRPNDSRKLPRTY